MSHIFISYSRIDVEVAQEVANSLLERNLDVWIDLDNIPKGEDWWHQIQKGIEEAEAFVFLVSPDSIRSKVCTSEIEHALQHGKRMLPVVLRDVSSKEVHHKVSELNWIFCRKGQDDFEKAIDEIQKTIHTDYDWLQFHTELEVKAIRWQQKRDNSRLLRGKELNEANARIKAATTQIDLPLTALQREFVSISVRQNRVRRVITSLLLIMLACASCVAVVGSVILLDHVPDTVDVFGQTFEIRNRFGYRFLSQDVGSTIAVYSEPRRLVPTGEYLIVIGTDADGEHPGTVLAYNMNGKIRWEHEANTDPYYGPTANFKVRRIMTDQILGDGEYQVIFTTQKTDWFPSELIMLDAKGELLGSYWNSGFIYDVLAHDLDKDGIKELVISAVNNNLGYVVVNDETKHPAIVYALSPSDDFTGQTFPPLIDGRPFGTEFNNWTAVLEPFDVGQAQLRIVQENNQDLIEVVTLPLGGYIYLDSFGRIQRVGVSDFWRSERGDQSPADLICFIQRRGTGWSFSASTERMVACPWYSGQ